MSSGHVWLRLVRVTRRLVKWPPRPETVIADGKGLLDPLSGIVMGVGLLKIGRASSDRIVPVATLGEPSRYPVPLVTVSTTVSLAISARLSVMGSITTVAVV